MQLIDRALIDRIAHHTDHRWTRYLMLAALIGIVTVLTPDPAFAQSAGNGLNSLAQNVLAILQNGFVRTVAVIAVIIVGLGWLTGRINFSTLIAVVVGIFIIFSAPWIVDQITGGGAGG